jgi:hypothetical protein
VDDIFADWVKRRDEAGRWLYGKLALQLNVASRWLGFDAHDRRAVQLVSTIRFGCLLAVCSAANAQEM